LATRGGMKRNDGEEKKALGVYRSPSAARPISKRGKDHRENSRTRTAVRDRGRPVLEMRGSTGGGSVSRNDVRRERRALSVKATVREWG